MLRHPKTTQEKKAAQENQELIRAKRSKRQLVDAWDDIRNKKEEKTWVIARKWIKSQVGKDTGKVYSAFIKKFPTLRNWWSVFVDKAVAFDAKGKPLDSRDFHISGVYTFMGTLREA